MAEPNFSEIGHWKFATTTILNQAQDNNWLHSTELLVVCIDCQTPSCVLDQDKIPAVGTIIVPRGQEHDWLFSTRAGQTSLLKRCFNLTRLFIVSNSIPRDLPRGFKATQSTEQQVNSAKRAVTEILMGLHPSKWLQAVPLPRVIDFIEEIDGESLVFRRSTHLLGMGVGAHNILDEEFIRNGKKLLRRRLRFKDTPSWIHEEVLLVAHRGGIAVQPTMDEMLLEDSEVSVTVDLSMLSHATSIYMMASFNVLSSILQPGTRVLSLGVRGGALLNFMDSHFQFHVVGVESSNVSAHLCFEAGNSSNVYLITYDPVSLIDMMVSPTSLAGAEFPNVPNNPTRDPDLDSPFDVLLLDMHEPDLCAQLGLSSPPRGLLSTDFITKLKSVVNPIHGTLIINVIPPDYLFYQQIKRIMKTSFPKVFQFNIMKDNHFILIGTSSTEEISTSSKFYKQLRSLIPASYFIPLKEI